MADDIILEIEESIRQERIEKLWKEYGSYILAAAFLAVILTAGLTGWRGWNEKANIRQTDSLLAALERDDKAAELAKIAEDLRPGQRAIAHMTAAGLLLEEGKKEEALSHYNALASDADAPSVFRDLATLMAVRLSWDMSDGKTGADMLLKMLAPLWDDAANPWQYEARLQAALILAQGAQNYEAARKHLAVILAAPDLPRTLTERARALDHLYEMDMKNAASEEPKG